MGHFEYRDLPGIVFGCSFGLQHSRRLDARSLHQHQSIWGSHRGCNAQRNQPAGRIVRTIRSWPAVNGHLWQLLNSKKGLILARDRGLAIEANGKFRPMMQADAGRVFRAAHRPRPRQCSRRNRAFALFDQYRD